MGPEPAPKPLAERVDKPHPHEASAWGRGIHAERHLRSARWLRRGQLAACGILPAIMPWELRQDPRTVWLGSVVPPMCSLAFGMKASSHIMRAASLTDPGAADIRQIAQRVAVVQTASSVLVMASWSDFVMGGRRWDQAAARRRAIFLTSLATSLVSLQLERRSSRQIHDHISQAGNPPRRATPAPSGPKLDGSPP